MLVHSARQLLQKLSQKPARLGGGQSHINASVDRGSIVLSGTIQFEMQRQSVMKVVSSIPGVRRVMDPLCVKAKVRPS